MSHKAILVFMSLLIWRLHGGMRTWSLLICHICHIDDATCQVFFVFWVFFLAILIRAQWYLVFVLISNSLVTRDVEHLSQDYLSYFIFFLEDFFQIFCPVLNWFVFLFLSFKSTSIQLLYFFFFCIILSQCVSCLQILFSVPFTCIFNFDKVQFIIF